MEQPGDLRNNSEANRGHIVGMGAFRPKALQWSMRALGAAMGVLPLVLIDFIARGDRDLRLRALAAAGAMALVLAGTRWLGRNRGSSGIPLFAIHSVLPLLTGLGVAWVLIVNWHRNFAETDASSASGFSRPMLELLRTDLELHRAGVLRYAEHHGALPRDLSEAAPEMPLIESFVDWHRARKLAGCQKARAPALCLQGARFSLLDESWYTAPDSAADRSGTGRRPPAELSVLGLPLLYRRELSSTLASRQDWVRSNERFGPLVREFLTQTGGVPPPTGSMFYLNEPYRRALRAHIDALWAHARWLSAYLYGGAILIGLAALVSAARLRRRALVVAAVASIVVGTTVYLGVLEFGYRWPVYVTRRTLTTSSIGKKERRSVLEQALLSGEIDPEQAALARRWLRR